MTTVVFLDFARHANNEKVNNQNYTTVSLKIISRHVVAGKIITGHNNFPGYRYVLLKIIIQIFQLQLLLIFRTILYQMKEL
jgi:hypothetical protein